MCVSACDCYNPGSQGDGISSCAARSGQCPCLPNVAGLKCDKCWDGYWNIDSGRGQFTPLKCHLCTAQNETSEDLFFKFCVDVSYAQET